MKLLIVAALLLVQAPSRATNSKPENIPVEQSQPEQAQAPPDTTTAQPSPQVPEPEYKLTVREIPAVTVRKDWVDWGVWVFSALLVVVGFLQWSVLKTQANLLEEHAEHLENLAISARDNAKAARDNAQAIINSERAWIIVSPLDDCPAIGFIPEPGDEVGPPGREARNVFSASVKNSGNTPARIIELRVKYKQVSRLVDIPKKPDYEPRLPSDDEVLLVKDDSISAFAFLEPNIILSKGEMERVVRQESFLYAYGIAIYEDSFRQRHETRFGYIYHMPLGGDPIPRGFRREKLPSAYNRAT
jgi:hypothetical protein